MARPFCVQPRHRVVGEVRRGLGALHARERAALARVEHHDGERGGQRGEPLAQRRQRQLLAGQVDGRRPGVTRVVEDDLGLLAVQDARADLRGDVVEGGRRCPRGCGCRRTRTSAGIEVPELAQDARHALRVVLREVKGLLPGAPLVAAHDDGVRVRVGRRGDDGRRGLGGGLRRRQEGRCGEKNREKEGERASHGAYRPQSCSLTRQAAFVGTSPLLSSRGRRPKDPTRSDPPWGPSVAALPRDDSKRRSLGMTAMTYVERRTCGGAPGRLWTAGKP